MRIPALLLTIVTAALLTTPAGSQDRKKLSHKDQIQKTGQKVEDLRKEQIATLKELAKEINSLRGTPEEIFESRLLVLKSELAAAEKHSQRMGFYKNIVDLLKEYEKASEHRAKTERGTYPSFLKVKARRLEAEIQLEQAKGKNSNSEHQKILVTSPKVQDVAVSHQYACRIHSRRHIKIRSLQKGYLEEVLVKEGQTVKKGELLFKIASILYKTKLDAELAEAKIAELEFRNNEKLFKNKVISIDELSRFQAKLAIAHAKVKLAQAELNYTLIRAPFDGIIDRLHEQQGSLITERDLLTTLSDNSVMWVYYNVPQTRYLEYMADQEKSKEKEEKIELVLPNSGKFPQSGKIAAIEAEFDHESGNISFRGDFPNPNGLLRHGMVGTVLTHRTLKNAIVIPQQAAFEILGKLYVFVVGKDNVAHQREIAVQHELPGNFVIKRGVGADDKIIFEGIRQIRDGEKIEYEFRRPDQILGHPQGQK